MARNGWQLFGFDQRYRATFIKGGKQVELSRDVFECLGITLPREPSDGR